MDYSTWLVIAGPLVVAFAVCLLLTPPLIGKLRQWGFGQHIREDGPATHESKQGTPSAAGVVIVIAICSAGAAFVSKSHAALLLCALVVGCGVTGFLDDYGKASVGRSLGLRARHKMLLLLILAAVFSWAAAFPLQQGRALALPGGGEWRLPPAAAFGFSVLLILFFTNAVNLTDGLDGLAAGTTAIVGVAMAAALLAKGSAPEAAVCAAMVGACLAFLVFNAHPAAAFMGDTGALALGGALAGAAILSGRQLLLCVAGLAFVVEALSVVGQVASFQLTGKRILRMSPLHHHFELKGIGEKGVVRGFWLASAALSLLGVAVF